MSGVAIIRTLLANHAPLLALMPASKIIAGQIRQDTVLPAISIRTISENEQATSARNLTVKMLRERVQVTIYTKDFVQLDKIRKACSLGRGVHTGTVATFKVLSVLPEYVGPYLGPDGDEIHEQSRDFMVTFIEAN